MKAMAMEDLLKEPCHYIRYGDGNWLVLSGNKMKNCDGHRMGIPGMREEMIRTIAVPRDGVLYAMTDFGREKGRDSIRKYSHPSIQWADGDIPKRAFQKDQSGIDGLIPFMEERRERLVYVAPRHFAKLNGVFHFVTNQHDCWLQKAEAEEYLLNNLYSIDVVIFAASFLTCCAVYDLHEVFKGKWMLDIGSALDPLCGVMSRDYHSS